MPAADRTTEPTRGSKTICIPCSQEQYGRIVDDPVLFREFLDQQIEATPELFPPEIRRGDRMKDLSTSRKTGWRLRRIDLRNNQSYSVRPCFLMPYLSGRTEEVQARPQQCCKIVPDSRLCHFQSAAPTDLRARMAAPTRSPSKAG